MKDKVFSRFALTYAERAGTVKNLFDGSHINDLQDLGGRGQLRFFPTDHLEINLSGDYSQDDATFVNFQNFVPGKNASGHRIPFTSKFSANASLQYRFPLFAWADLVMRWDMAYKSSSFYDVANTLKEPGYVLVNARMGFQANRWEIFGFVRNLFNEEYRTMSLFTPTSGGPVAAPGDPRTYGLQVRVNF